MHESPRLLNTHRVPLNDDAAVSLSLNTRLRSKRSVASVTPPTTIRRRPVFRSVVPFRRRNNYRLPQPRFVFAFKVVHCSAGYVFLTSSPTVARSPRRGSFSSTLSAVLFRDAVTFYRPKIIYRGCFYEHTRAGVNNHVKKRTNANVVKQYTSFRYYIVRASRRRNIYDGRRTAPRVIHVVIIVAIKRSANS